MVVVDDVQAREKFKMSLALSRFVSASGTIFLLIRRLSHGIHLSRVARYWHRLVRLAYGTYLLAVSSVEE